MTRRNQKEYRPDEALDLIASDRAETELSCPSCGSSAFTRDPARRLDAPNPGRVTLSCVGCGRSVCYTDRNSTHLG